MDAISCHLGSLLGPDPANQAFQLTCIVILKQTGMYIAAKVCRYAQEALYRQSSMTLGKHESCTVSCSVHVAWCLTGLRILQHAPYSLHLRSSCLRHAGKILFVNDWFFLAHSQGVEFKHALLMQGQHAERDPGYVWRTESLHCRKEVSLLGKIPNTMLFCWHVMRWLCMLCSWQGRQTCE